MLVTIVLTLLIVIFCIALHREENRKKSSNLNNSSDNGSDVLKESIDSIDSESLALKRQLREKEEIICKLRAELNENNAKMETNLSLTKTSQELALRNDERTKSVTKLWEEKNERLSQEVKDLTEEVVQLKRQIEKADDELNSYQHKLNTLSRLLVDSEDRIEDLESQLESLFEVEEKSQQKSYRIQHLEGDIEQLEELRRKESDKLRNLIRDKDSKIEQLESICSELRLTTAVTSL